MIPKILHFIWFGRKPEYVDYCIDAFRKMNPSFQINLMWNLNVYAYEDLMEDINTCSGKYKKAIEYCKKLRIEDEQILSDILRLVLLNISGGIYLDCDCFPLRPFDDDLLKEDFVVTRYYSREFIGRDCFFMGKQQETDDILFYKDFPAREILLSEEFDQINVDFHLRRVLFKNRKLPFKKNPGPRYIEHFQLGAWRNK